MRNLTIHKFGGTSVGSAERITATAAIIASSQEPALVVTSAMSGTTDALLRAISAAADGRAGSAYQTSSAGVAAPRVRRSDSGRGQAT